MHHGSIFLLLVLPIGSQAWAWTVAVICTALLHYMGKITVDMEIHQRDGAR
nr:TraI domain-containing protein [Escherichia coli]